MRMRIHASVACCNNQKEGHFRVVRRADFPMDTVDPEAKAREAFTADGWECVPGQPEYCPDCKNRRDTEGRLTATRK